MAKNIALFLSFIAFGLILSMPAYCWDRGGNIEKAVRNFQTAYQRNGMSLMRNDVDKCYQRAFRRKSLEMFEYCAAYDLSAYFRDDQMVRTMNFPPQEYFVLEAVTRRVEEGLAAMGYPENSRAAEAKFIADTTVKWFRIVFKSE